MVIQHNVFALFASRENKVVLDKKEKSAEKLSTGYRINRAADDAAGLAISEEMRKQIRGLNRGAQNIDEGINYCRTADGALNEVHDMLQRMNELAVQAANGPNSDSDRAAISEEVDHIKTEIDRIFQTTRYNEEYIFKTDEPESEELTPYELAFKAYPNNIFIYNETYDNGTATYGGVSYNGKRYAWSTVSPTMFDPTTNMFRKGTYTLNASDGTRLTLTCENGSTPPQVSCEYTMMADAGGIKINDEKIDWKDVKDDKGMSINPKYIEAKNYSFNYHGVKISFKPEPEDDFPDLLAKLSYVRWKSDYQIPNQDTALYGDFSSTRAYFSSNEQVREYISGNSVASYTICASDGKKGFDGIWLKDKDGKTVAGSEMTWEQLGIKEWGDGSTDINKNRNYEYSCKDPINPGSYIKFSFTVINEISKDSAIEALDGVKLVPSKDLSKISASNSVRVSLDGNTVSVDGNTAKILSTSNTINKYDTPEMILKEQYYLGRDFEKEPHKYVDENLTCVSTAGGIEVTVSYSYTIDGNTTTKTFTGKNPTAVDDIKKAISISVNTSANGIVAARSLAGAKNPILQSLSELVPMTGNGQNTNLKEVLQFASTSTISASPLKSTYTTNPNDSYAGAHIDFSGLGQGYGLMDLIGMGFNSTCASCSNHYSIQFVTNSMIGSAQWNSLTTGNPYQYALENDGSDNLTLYVNLDSMSGTINDGAKFTNALIDIINSPKVKQSDFYRHYTKYATYEDDAILYVFDERSDHSNDPYVKNGQSTAISAAFQPHAFKPPKGTTVFDITLKDNDVKFDNNGNPINDYVKIQYQCDFSDMLSGDHLKITASDNANGAYVKSASSKYGYELYDAKNPNHSGLQRFDITKIELDITDNLIQSQAEKLVNSAITNTRLDITGSKASYSVDAEVNENNAMVTNYNTPRQIIPPNSNGSFGDFLNIHCSSNARDFIRIQRQKLSVKKLGLTKLSVATEPKATKAIAILENVLSKVSKSRSTFGAYQNRLEHAYAINQNTAENTQYAESQIRDTDMAEEMVKYSNADILSQAGTSMLAQANQMNQAVLNLLS